jgi:hypothetical protein
VLRWRGVAERLVRPLGVVLVPERVEAALLHPERRLRRLRGLHLERAVHALKLPILLGGARLGQLGRDAELDPPRRERGEVVGVHLMEHVRPLRACVRPRAARKS